MTATAEKMRLADRSEISGPVSPGTVITGEPHGTELIPTLAGCETKCWRVCALTRRPRSRQAARWDGQGAAGSEALLGLWGVTERSLAAAPCLAEPDPPDCGRAAPRSARLSASLKGSVGGRLERQGRRAPRSRAACAGPLAPVAGWASQGAPRAPTSEASATEVGRGRI
jgi:hypothetical protein